MLQPASIRFLKDLRKNNNKEWFDKNRAQYEAAKQDFGQLVQTLIDRFANKDEDIAHLKAKDCTFRINRDVRFSKDKSPYKTNMGASINKGGKKTMTAGYYFHFEPSNSFVGGGLYAPMPEDLKKVRQEIDYSFDEFKEIIGSKKFKAIYGDLNRSNEYSLSRPPKGYEQDNPAIEYLKLKSFIAMTNITDAELTGKDLVKKITDAFEALMPVIKFMHRAMEH